MLKIKAKSILKRATLNKFTDLIYRIFNILKSNIFHLYRFNILLVIATSLALTYYLILVQIKPFSSPFLKSKVLEVLIKKSGKDFAVDDVLISFTSSGLVKLDMINITSSDFSRAMDNSLVDIPKVSFAFPIYRLMSLDFMPSTLLLDDASFVVDSVDNLFDFGAMGGSSNKKQLKKITSLMKSIKAVKISNTSVKVSNKIKGSVSFFVSEAEFRIKSKRSINKISSNISFEVVDSDLESTKIEIDSYCVLTNKSLDGNCRASLSNVDLNIFSKFSNDHNILDKIKSNSFFGIVFTKNAYIQS